MPESPPSGPPPREASAPTALELEVANMFVRGIGSMAIGLCVARGQPDIQFYVYSIYQKMSETLNVPHESLDRRDMYEWLSERGLLFTDGAVEAVLARAISALESVPSPASWPTSTWPIGIQWLMRIIGRPSERDRLERHLAEEMAVLEEARMAMREPFPPQED